MSKVCECIDLHNLIFLLAFSFNIPFPIIIASTYAHTDVCVLNTYSHLQQQGDTCCVSQTHIIPTMQPASLCPPLFTLFPIGCSPNSIINIQ